MKIIRIMEKVHLWLIFAGLANIIEGSKILGVFPAARRSTFSFNDAIMRALSNAGHEVIVVSPFPPLNKMSNYSHVDLWPGQPQYVSSLDVSHVYGKYKDSLIENAKWSFGIDQQYCKDVMSSEKFAKILDTENIDAVITEIDVNNCLLIFLGSKLKCPIIGVVSSMLSFGNLDRFTGNINNPSFIPILESSCSHKMDFFERVLNTIHYVCHVLMQNFIFDVEGRRMAETFLGTNSLADDDISDRLKLIFTNSHVSVLPRPLVPNIIEVAGIQLGNVKQLSEDILQFIENAKDGVIYFSLGSMTKGSSLPEVYLNALLDAFSEIPQRVVMKLELDDTSDVQLPDNVMSSKWLPQLDILAHEKVIAFISHGGINGIYEAIHTATPIIGIPLMFDQSANLAILKELGVSYNVDLPKLTKDSTLQALKAILNPENGYQKRMLDLSKIFKDRPLSANQSVVYWTEYVIRNAKPFKSPAAHLPLYQYLLMDILAALVLTLWVIYLILSAINA